MVMLANILMSSNHETENVPQMNEQISELKSESQPIDVNALKHNLT